MPDNLIQPPPETFGQRVLREYWQRMAAEQNRASVSYDQQSYSQQIAGQFCTPRPLEPSPSATEGCLKQKFKEGSKCKIIKDTYDHFMKIGSIVEIISRGLKNPLVRDIKTQKCRYVPDDNMVLLGCDEEYMKKMLKLAKDNSK